MKMKKFILDESLFTEDEINFDTKVDKLNSLFDDVDDDYAPYIPDEHEVRDDVKAPETEEANGAASQLIRLINDEWEAIQGYNDSIQMFKAMAQEIPILGNAVNVLEEIVAEENRHVGQLQEVLTRISTNTSEIQSGGVEDKKQLNTFVNGKLPVQTFESTHVQSTSAAKNPENPNEIDTTCTLMDVDDDM